MVLWDNFKICVENIVFVVTLSAFFSHQILLGHMHELEGEDHRLIGTSFTMKKLDLSKFNFFFNLLRIWGLVVNIK